MKRTILISILVSLAFPAFSSDDILRVEVIARSERVVDGEKEIRVLSNPSVGAVSGEESEMGVVSEFSTEVPMYEKLTKQEGKCGVTLSVTPTSVDSNILLKGVVMILKAPSIQSLEENGAVAVQESCNVQFSLKVILGTPFELSPIEMPDGSKLLLTFTASKKSTLGRGMSRKERELSRKQTTQK